MIELGERERACSFGEKILVCKTPFILHVVSIENYNSQFLDQTTKEIHFQTQNSTTNEKRVAR
jgi:hypothetical protein